MAEDEQGDTDGMSTRCTDIVWQELDVTGQEKLLLLAIADISNHEGDNIHPSNEYLVWLTGIPLRTVQFFKSKWRDMGALLPVENEAGGAGNFVRYELHLEKFPRKREWEGKRARAASFHKRPEKIKDAGTALLPGEKDAPTASLGTDKGCNRTQSKGAVAAPKDAIADTKGCNGAQRNKEEPLTEPLVGTVSGNQQPRLSQSERDSWDLRRWRKEMELIEGASIGGPEVSDEAYLNRARRAAYLAGVSIDRVRELLKQFFPDDPLIDRLTNQKPLFEQETA